MLSSAALAAPTVVTLTFDDGLANQYGARSALAANSLHGTFYVNTGRIGSSDSFLSWSQLDDLAADGNEIGGHTLDHVDLTAVSAAEAQRQVCDDRRALVARGFSASSFAYPYGAHNSTLYSIVESCGYSSARRSWGLCDAIGVSGCTLFAETFPPPSVWAVRTVPSIRTWHTLADLQSAVTRAEAAGGGWVPIVFHHICDGCDPDGYSTSPTTLGTFLSWLAARSSSGTVVRTVRDVATDTTAPVSSAACDDTVCPTWSRTPVSVALSATDTASGVATIRYTTNGSDPTSSSTQYTGPFTISSTATVKFRAWDYVGNVETTKSRLIQIDSTAPASVIACNGTTCAATPYPEPVTVSFSATDSGSGVAAIRYTTDGSDPTSSSTLYGGPFSVSSTTTLKFRAWDVAGNVEQTNTRLVEVATAPTDTTPPTSSIACNGGGCSTGWYSTSVSIVLSATDAGSGVDVIRYTTDGTDPTMSSQIYTGPFAIGSTTTVKYRAWDRAGNVEAVKAQTVRVDTIAPTVAITSPLNGATVTKTVRITVDTSDSGSGVTSVAFYVDGVLVGTSTSAPYQVQWNTKKSAVGQRVLTVVATDAAGNARTSAPVYVTVK